MLRDWKPEFKELIRQGGQWKDIVTRCGARIPKIEKRAVSLSAVVTFSDLSSEVRQTIDTSLSANYGSGPLTASASLAINTEFKDAQEHGRVDVQVYVRGGDAESLFEDTIKAAVKKEVTVDGIGAALAKFAGTLSKEKAATVGFFVTDLPLLDVAKNDPWNVEKEHRIETIAGMYFDVSDKRNQLNAIVNQIDPRYRAYSADELHGFREDVTKANELADKVIALLGTCKASLPPQIEPCDIPAALVASANALRSIPLLQPPSGDFRVAVRNPPPAGSAVIPRWRLMSDDDSALVMKSVARAKTDELVDFAPTANRFHEDFRVRVRGQTNTAEREALGFFVSSDHLDTIEIVAKPADELTKSFRVGSGDPVLHGKIWEKAQLSNSELTPDVELSEDENFRDARRQYSVWLDFDFLNPPPESPARCTLGAKKTPECQAYFHRYFEGLPLEISVLPTLEMAIAIRSWIQSGQVMKGNGTLYLRAHDTYSGERNFELMKFEWDADEQLHIAKVTYHFGNGTENVWFLTKLGPRSAEFPLLNYTYRWSLPIGRSQKVYDYPEIHDKWNELQIKFCTNQSQIVPVDPGLAQYVDVSIISNDRKTARATASYKGPAPFGVPAVFDITLKARVKTSSNSIFAPKFYDSDSGCDVKTEHSWISGRLESKP